MLQSANLPISSAVAKHSEAMESRDHFNNGAQPKSHTSRVTYNLTDMKKLFFVFCVLAAFSFASCKKECKCSVEGVEVSSAEMSKKECEDTEKAANAAGMGIVKTKCVRE